jgi:hypothetical protein
LSRNLFLLQQTKNETSQEKKIDSRKVFLKLPGFTKRERRRRAGIDSKNATIKARRRIEIYLRKFIKA